MKAELLAASATPGRPRAVTGLQKKEGGVNGLGAAVLPLNKPGLVASFVVEEARSCHMQSARGVFLRAETRGGQPDLRAVPPIYGAPWMCTDRSVQPPKSAVWVAAKRLGLGPCGERGRCVDFLHAALHSPWTHCV